MTEPSISVDSLGIKFFLNYERTGRREAFRSLLLRRKKKEFWALRDISFETHKGEIFGIIGSNGAGKSTLLKIIAGIYPSTTGSVSFNGTIAPLIEIGAAFNPELTGVENIFLTGSIYKIPRPVIRQNFDRIVEFSGLKDFIDTPIKNYSSGMFIRLAFSIVIFFQPDIVLIDEVFSVGDVVFQQKSFEKIISFKKKGATIVLVSHDANIINQICDRVLVLNRGRLSHLGPAEDAVDHYHQLLRRGDSLGTQPPAEAGEIKIPEARRWGNKKVEITSVSFVDASGRPKSVFRTGDYFEVRMEYRSSSPGIKPVFGTAFYTIYKMLIYGPNTLDIRWSDAWAAEGRVRLIMESLPLFEGDYLFSASAYDPSLQIAYDHHEMMYHFKVQGTGGHDFGCVRMDCRWERDHA